MQMRLPDFFVPSMMNPEALKADATLLETNANLRHEAISAAALAAAGKGGEVITEEKERARLRQQAQDGLKVALAVWNKQSAEGKQDVRDGVRRSIAQ